MMTIKMSDLLWAGAVAAVFALALPGSAAATEYGFTGVVQNLGNLSNPGTLDFGDSGATGVNDGTHFDYIYSFTLANPAKIDANVMADGGNFDELHAVLYNADPSGQGLFTNGDPGIVGGGTNTNLIDIGSFANFLTGGSGGNGAGVSLASLAAGSYYLRIFGVETGAVSHFLGQIVASSVTATTPIPAALPLFLSAIGALGFAARRRRKSEAVLHG